MNWPTWAPTRLTELHDVLLSVSAEAREEGSQALQEVAFQVRSLEVIRTLCTDLRMESVWSVIQAKASSPDIHCDLALVATNSILPPQEFQRLTPAQFLKKRAQAAAAARNLRNILAEMGFDSQTIFPILGARAISGPVQYFLQDQGTTLPPDAKEWTLELKRLNKMMITNAPGVGTWRDLLDRLATTMEADGKGWQDYKRVDGPDDEAGRARNFAFSLDDFFRERCGCQLVPQVMTMTEIFFPDECRENRDAINISVWRRGKHS